MNNYICENISYEVIKTLYRRFKTFPENTSNLRNAPFHEAFLKAFSKKISNEFTDLKNFISLSSWLQGLNTSLGQSFFENVSHILSGGIKKGFTRKNNNNLLESPKQKSVVDKIITNLQNGSSIPNLEQENKAIFINSINKNFIEAIDFTADVFIEDKNEIVCIEIKSVKPNAGEIRGEKRKILEAKSALFNKFQDKNIKYYIGFPFDPTSNSETGYEKKRFLSSIVGGSKYLDLKEIIIASEFWNLLSGRKNTMNDILSIINKIATPEFMEKFEFINNHLNINSNNYIKQLKDWYLFSEAEIILNKEIITSRLDKRGKRIFNQPIFKTHPSKSGGNIKYNNSRYEFLRMYM